MKKIFLLLNLIAGLLIISSCASSMRKRCEKMNWFERGQNLALNGQSSQDDSQLKECRRVEAEFDESQFHMGYKRGRELYCHPERAFLIGKQGQTFATDFCDQATTKALLKKHAEGVRAYCTPETGKQLGASGEVFNPICPADLEPAFKIAYSKARKSYLEAQLPEIQQQLEEKKKQQSSAKNELMFLEGQKLVLVTQQTSAHIRSPISKESKALDERVDNLNNQIGEKNKFIKGNQKDINALMSQLASIKGEIAGLKE